MDLTYCKVDEVEVPHPRVGLTVGENPDRKIERSADAFQDLPHPVLSSLQEAFPQNLVKASDKGKRSGLLDQPDVAAIDLPEGRSPMAINFLQAASQFNNSVTSQANIQADTIISWTLVEPFRGRYMLEDVTHVWNCWLCRTSTGSGNIIGWPQAARVSWL